MRILSFTNLPLPAVSEHLGISSSQLQGWVEGLRVAFKQFPDVELGYASVSSESFSPFQFENAIYYNILPPASHRFPRAWFDQWRHKIDFPDAIGQCLRIIDEYHPDVIHINGTEGLFGLIQSYTNIPVVISLQGFLTVVQRKFFRGIEPADLIKSFVTKDFIRGTGQIHQYWTLRRAARREMQVISDARCFIGRTNFDRNFINLYNPSATYFHCDEVLRPEFYSAHWDFETSRRNSLYFVSSVNTYKGIDCLLEAMALVKHSMKDIQIRISGAFPNSKLWPWIKRKIVSLDIENNTTWLGLSSPNEVAHEMESSSLFVIPSYIDNSPNSLAEAMLVGTPCIASYVGGIPSMVTDNENGLLFPVEDPYSLAGCILRILSDKQLANRLSENARILARTRNDPSKISKRMLRIYSLLAGNDGHFDDKTFDQQ